MKGKRISEARRWFQQACYDLKAARWNIEGGFHNTACFLAHQSAEKALKSFLYYVGARRSALFTHSLVEMINEAEKHVSSLAVLVEEARDLDLHYIPSRYPNGLPGGYPHRFYGTRVAEEALIAAGKILDTIEKYYQSEAESAILEPD